MFLHRIALLQMYVNFRLEVKLSSINICQNFGTSLESHLKMLGNYYGSCFCTSKDLSSAASDGHQVLD